MKPILDLLPAETLVLHEGALTGMLTAGVMAGDIVHLKVDSRGTSRNYRKCTKGACARSQCGRWEGCWSHRERDGGCSVGRETDGQGNVETLQDLVRVDVVPVEVDKVIAVMLVTFSQKVN